MELRAISFRTGPLDVFEQMAFDEICVRDYKGGFIARFYEWVPGAFATFGYAQFFNEVKKTLPDGFNIRQTTRRPTGGGLVMHGADITFSLIIPSEGQLSPKPLYGQIHDSVFMALKEIGINCAVCAQTGPGGYMPSCGEQASACFKNPMEQDILDADGAKILGGAIRKFDKAVLYQGSLQMPDARKIMPKLQPVMLEYFSKRWGAQFREESAPEELMRRTKVLADEVYRNICWINKF